MGTKRETRGVRNCNPLNIRIGNDWKGERPTNSDGVFEQFTDMHYGLRAAFILLLNNGSKRLSISLFIESRLD